MAGKTTQDYRSALGFLESMIDSQEREYDWKEYTVLTDYEFALKNSAEGVFYGCTLNSCYFHFRKALWSNYIKKVTDKTARKQGYPIYVFLKFLPFLHKVLDTVGYEKEIIVKAAFKLFADGEEFDQFRLYILNRWLNDNFQFEDHDERIKKTTNGVENIHSVFFQNRLTTVSDYSVFVAKLVKIDELIIRNYFELVTKKKTRCGTQRSNITGIALVDDTLKETLKVIAKFKQKCKERPDFCFERIEEEEERFNVFESQAVPEDDYDDYYQIFDERK